MNALTLQEKLLTWYDQHRRTLPWRAQAGMHPNPYHVWLSEIMLQQTQVATVIPYFNAFIERWPTVTALATASLDDVFHAWQGLGYYSRARNLHACAQTVAASYHGIFPQTFEALRLLPGIGDYTAAAIAAIAYDHPVVPVDGNVVRVFSRLLALTTPLPALKDEVWEVVKSFTPQHRAGDFAQALMDLGATLCRPRSPDCSVCPFTTECLAYRQEIAENLPRKASKPQKPTRYGMVFAMLSEQQEIYLQRRPEKGLLAGLMEVPSTPWIENPWSWQEAVNYAPIQAQWQSVDTMVSHTFTHFHLKLGIVIAKISPQKVKEGQWVHLSNLKSVALPTVMKKVMKAVIK